LKKSLSKGFESSNALSIGDNVCFGVLFAVAFVAVAVAFVVIVS
jgi:hypothetical protein